MNRRGTVVFVALMVAFIVFVMGVVMIEPIKDQVDISRTALNCSSDSLTTGEEMTCIGNDFMLPAFILTVFGVALAWIGAKKLGNQGAA